MKRLMLFVLLTALMPWAAFAQSYDELWKQIDEAAEKDLPRTQIELLEKLANKATKGKDYGQLLPALLMKAGLQWQIAPDSLEVETERLKAGAANAEKKDPVFAAVYNAVLGKVAKIRRGTLEPSSVYFDKALARPELLAKEKTSRYKPLISTEADSRIFNDDLLHVIGMEAGRYRELQQYYDRAGNRSAACLSASLYSYYNKKELDSLINVYGDLPEAGELAKQRYGKMYNENAETKLDYINEALLRWKNWPHMAKLENERMDLLRPGFYVNVSKNWVVPGQTQKMYLSNVRNLQTLKITFSRLDIEGETRLSPSNDDDYAALKKKVVPGEPAFSRTLTYADQPPYKQLRDTIEIPSLPTGVYLLEYAVDGNVLKNKSLLYYVSNINVLYEQQPQKTIRYVVVNNSTGQPIPNASLRLTFDERYKTKRKVKNLKADAKGEVIDTYDDYTPDRVFAYTDTDKAFPAFDARGEYIFSPDHSNRNLLRVYTDRTLYRPGQDVHASIMLYHRASDNKFEACPVEKVTIRLRDANRKEVAKREVTTDEFGVAAADFTLPTSGLTGRFSVDASGSGTSGSASFNVEEYKRPTFEVEFPEYKEHYANGDTVQLPGIAKTYAGVPVQGASVKYTVKRTYAFWWYRYYGSDSGTTMAEGTTTTDENGQFKVPVPMILPSTTTTNFYLFKVDAQVTDGAGESRSGATSLPLGNKSTALSCDLPDKIRQDSLTQVTFMYKNAAGLDIDGLVSYCVDGGKETKVKANTSHKWTLPLKSGKHVLQAICGTDTINVKFTVFSITDKQPVSETDDWFYVSNSEFPKDGTPVYVQVGSSAPDQHIVYSIISGTTVLENGVIDQSNALTTRAFKYEERYETGITLTYAWIKNGTCYKHVATIAKPLPDKRLLLTWKTFRDRLTPGQKEHWTLSVKRPDGKPAKAQLMATLYDKSLDQIKKHNWNFSLSLVQPLAYTDWNCLRPSSFYSRYDQWQKHIDVTDLSFSKFEPRYFYYYEDPYYNRPMPLMSAVGGSSRARIKGAGLVEESADMMVAQKNVVIGYGKATESKEKEEDEATDKGDKGVQLRENFNETAFFYPRLVADAAGNINIDFTLPESVTTWRMMGLAHDKLMNYGSIVAEAVATKTIMVQPNMPRFVRYGDQAQLTARLFNTSEKAVKGTAKLELLNPETEKVLKTFTQDFTVNAKGTGNIVFDMGDLASLNQPMLIARTTASGVGFSDGEQHYLAVLPNQELVTNTLPFTQHEAGVKEVDLQKLFPTGTTHQKLTVEYTDNPSWLMVQALPFMAEANEKNAISLTTAFYANSIARYLLNNSPKVKPTIELWKKETGKETSLMSSLQKNESLKELALNETPWVLEAENETEQKQALIRFFDENIINSRLKHSIDNLKKLQNGDGSWSWWPGMPGSAYMTAEVSKMLVRLNTMIGVQDETSNMLDNAFDFMKGIIHQEVKEMKKLEKKGDKDVRPSELAVDYLYTCALDGRELSSSAKSDRDYLIEHLAGRTRELTIYGKAVTAVILAKNKRSEKAAEYLQSIKEYSVFTEEMGRYYDTRKAYYSWFDYKIPTEVAAIEALKAIAPEDRQTVEEMQRWLLMSKRTQAWDTPVNSVNAVFAFSENGQLTTLTREGEPAQLKLDGKPIDMPKATAGLGYVKTCISEPKAQTFTAEKTTSGTSWGALYAQFMQPVTDIATAESGIVVRRELLNAETKEPVTSSLKVGDKVTIRITLTADRDYDFVQVIDKRAACLEPAKQLSGYRNGYYISPKDYTTNYYFDQLSKGKHVVTTDYYVDREGTYQTGTCTAQCAYAPEYSGRDKAIVIQVKGK